MRKAVDVRVPRWRQVAIVVATTIALAGGAATPVSDAATLAPTPTAPCGYPNLPVHYTHVVWILLENVGYSLVGSPSAPYFNALASECGLATNDHAVAHPSLPNYVALTSGSTQGISDDGEPSAHPLRVASIFSQLRGRWRAYAQSMPSPCDVVTSGTYAARHNPAVYYVNVRGACRRRDVAMPARLDLGAPFTFIAPNVCDDMHSCPLTVGDRWLHGLVDQLVANPLYRAGSLAVFITFDESDSSATNQIPTLVVAPSVPRGLRVGVALTHYSLLRTSEQLLGLAPLGAARTARSLIGPFHLERRASKAG